MVKPQKLSLLQRRSCYNPRLKQGPEQNLTVRKSYQSFRNKSSYQTPHNKPSGPQPLKLMKNLSAKKNKARAKTEKALSKLGLRQVTGVTRVTNPEI